MTANSSSNNENNSNKNAQKSSPLAPFLKSIGGDDCDRPACDDTKSALSAALERIGRASSSSSTSGEKTVKSSQVKGMSSDTTTFTAANDASVGYNACPPTRDEIGTSTWSLLHSMAAWYPNNPTSEDRHSISSFMTALAKFYPCTWCATDFQKNIELSPPRTETREDLCMWICEQHNIVNDKLGKPLFHCTLEKLDERWRKSSDSKCNK